MQIAEQPDRTARSLCPLDLDYVILRNGGNGQASLCKEKVT